MQVTKSLNELVDINKSLLSEFQNIPIMLQENKTSPCFKMDQQTADTPDRRRKSVKRPSNIKQERTCDERKCVKQKEFNVKQRVKMDDLMHWIDNQDV